MKVPQDDYLAALSWLFQAERMLGEMCASGVCEGGDESRRLLEAIMQARYYLGRDHYEKETGRPLRTPSEYIETQLKAASLQWVT